MDENSGLRRLENGNMLELLKNMLTGCRSPVIAGAGILVL